MNRENVGRLVRELVAPETVFETITVSDPSHVSYAPVDPGCVSLSL